MDIDAPKTAKVVIPLKKRKIEVDPLNIDINLGVPTPFISKKNKNTSSLLEKAKNTLKEALEIEEKEEKKENISKLIISLDNIILNKKEGEKERKKEEEKDNNFNITLKEEILELKERISKVSSKIDTFSINSLKPIINSSNSSNIITTTNKNINNTWAEVLRKNNNNKGTTFTNISTPTKGTNINKNSTSYKNQRLVLITKDKNKEIDSYNLKNKVNKELKEKLNSSNNIIISIIKNKNNNIIITTKEGVSPNILLENRDILNNNFNYIKAIKDRDYFNLIIHDIPNNIYKGPLALERIKKELEEDNLGLSLIDSPKWLSKKENRATKKSSSIIISLNTEGEREKYLKKKLFLGGIQPRLEKYYISSPLDQCSRC